MRGTGGFRLNPRRVSTNSVWMSRAQTGRLQRSLGSREFQRLSQTIRRPARRKSAALAPGTRLLRQWQGRTHHVTVAASGFEYEGATYRSLSAIARRITGGSWSGPLFFGLRP